jgi:hypothetical protein
MHTCVLVADDRDIYDALAAYTNYDGEPIKPTSKWDFFGIGGRYEGALPLMKPRKLRRLLGLIPAGETCYVSVAKKSEIDQEAFLKEPPVALFFRDVLYECPLFAEGEALSKWQTRFRERFATIPDDTTLQIVDAHS